MADFRKSLLLAAMSLAIGVGTASAQTGSCTGTTGAPPNLRSQGETELTGQIVITCTGIPAASSVNINDILPTSSPVTSRVDEAYALVTTAGPVVNNYVYGGVQGNVVTFNGLLIPAGDFTLTIGGVRVNEEAFSGGSLGNSVVAALSVSNGSLPLQTSTFTVGYVLPGFTLGFSTAGISGATACSTAPTSVSLGAGTTTLSISENTLFPTAFKAQFPIVSGQDSETGPYTTAVDNPGVLVVTPGLTAGAGPSVVPATAGTMVSLTFAGIPSGLQFYIPTSVTAVQTLNQTIAVNGNLSLTLGPDNITTDVPNQIVDPAGLPPGNYIAVTGDSKVDYMITVTDPTVVETYNIPIYPVGPLSGAPNVTVGLDAAFSTPPIPPTNVPSFSTVPIGSSAGLLPGVGANTPCQTSLLFPFVTNQAGFDTGVSIAFTGNDPFGTASVTTGGVTANPPQCTLYYYSNPTFSYNGTALTPGTPTVGSTIIDIPVGGENHMTLSDPTFGQPNFQGYMIAVCNFQYAHGFAFITDGFGGTPTLAEGYVPFVLGDSRGVPDTTSTYVNGTAGPESLGN